MTPYAHNDYLSQPDTYSFSDGSRFGRVRSIDGNSSNYRFFRIEPIKWIVLNYNCLPSQYGTGGDGTHTRLELLANDVLMGGLSPNNIFWSDNTINTYLNDKFINKAFASESKTRLTTSTIYNNVDSTDSNINTTGSNSNYLASGSNLTTQKLYLLSYFEIANSGSPYVTNGIFRNNADRKEPGTDYAKAHNMFIHSTYFSADWWLRTTDGTYIYFVSTTGGAGTTALDNNGLGTRPAMQRGQ